MVVRRVELVRSQHFSLKSTFLVIVQVSSLVKSSE